MGHNMKSIVAILVAFVWAAAFLSPILHAQNFDRFKILDKGVIDYNSHYFQTEFGSTYQQSALKSPKISKTGDSYEISGDYVAGEKTYKFVERVTKASGGIDYESSVSSEQKVDGGFAFVLYMPSKLYLGKIWIDDKQFEQKSQGKFLARKIRVVGWHSTLEISGEFECEVAREKRQSKRNWGVNDNVRIVIKYLRESDNLYSLKLKLRNIGNFVGYAKFAKKSLSPLDLPLPDGEVSFVCTNYNIAKGANGIVIPAGQSASIGGSKKRANFLEILNGFDSAPAAEGVWGRVTVNYDGGVSETFEITKANSGAISAETPPAGATVAWRGEWKDKKVALYSTEIPLSGRPVKSVRLANESGSVWKVAAATYSANMLGAIPNEEYFIMQNDLYAPIVNKRPAKKGSILDMSWTLDAPAGKYGRVKPADGYFTFEKAPDKKVRFYGANNCFTANAPSHEDAVSMVEQYAALGFNIVRIHHYDQLCTTSANGDSAQLNEEVMDRFDFMFNEFKKRGIYVTLDFYTTRKLLRKEYADIDYEGDNMKLVFAASDMGVENLCRFIGNILNHVNKYTGIAYKDDPALFSACVRNESSYIGKSNFMLRTPMDVEAMEPKYEKWLASNKSKWEGRKENELWQLFMLDSYDETHGKLVKAIKAASPDLLITDQNHWGGFMTKAMSKNYDFACQNAYYGHPAYMERKYTVPMEIRSDPPINSHGGSTVSAFVAGIFGKPLMMSEWNYLNPNPYCSQGAFLVGAYGALNDVGALCYFAYSHAESSITKNTLLSGFDFASNPILSLSHRAAVMMYLRGDVKSATVSFPIPLLTNFYRNGSTDGWAGSINTYTYLSLVGRVGHLLADDIESVKVPENAAAVLMSEEAWKSAKFSVPAYDIFSRGKFLEEIASNVNLDKGKIDLKNNTFTSSTGELFMDVKNVCWKAITPKTEAFALLEGQKLKGAFAASVKSSKSQASVLISSYDGKELSKSGRILILHLTDVMNSRQKFATANMDVVLSWGANFSDENPILVRDGKVQITVNQPLEGFKLYAVDTDGERLFEVPIRRAGNMSVLNLSVHNKKGSVLAYELVREN